MVWCPFDLIMIYNNIFKIELHVDQLDIILFYKYFGCNSTKKKKINLVFKFKKKKNNFN